MIYRVHTLHKDRQLFILLLLSYKALLEYAYIFHFQQRYEYAGFVYSGNYIKLLASCLLLIIMQSQIRLDDHRISKQCVGILLIFVYIPLLSYSWIADVSYLMIFEINATFFILSAVTNLPISNRAKIKTYDSRNTNVIVRLVFLTYILMGIYLIIKSGGLDLRSLDFSLAYNLRSENSIIFEDNKIFGYIQHWCTLALFPYFVAFSYRVHKFKILLISVTLQLLLYLCFGFKSMLLSIVLVFLIEYSYKKRLPLKEILVSLIITDALALSVHLVLGNDTLFSLSLYRLCYEPAKVTYWFFDFFSTQKKLLFSEGAIGRLLDIRSPYPMGATYIVSQYHIGTSYNCNTGFLSDAYAQGGALCMYLMTSILAFVFVLMDWIGRGVGNKTAITAFAPLLITLMDNSLLTTLLTGGLILELMLLLLLSAHLQAVDACYKSGTPEWHKLTGIDRTPWARGYYESAVGLNESTNRKYVRRQDEGSRID